MKTEIVGPVQELARILRKNHLGSGIVDVNRAKDCLSAAKIVSDKPKSDLDLIQALMNYQSDRNESLIPSRVLVVQSHFFFGTDKAHPNKNGYTQFKSALRALAALGVITPEAVTDRLNPGREYADFTFLLDQPQGLEGVNVKESGDLIDLVKASKIPGIAARARVYWDKQKQSPLEGIPNIDSLWMDITPEAWLESIELTKKSLQTA